MGWRVRLLLIGFGVVVIVLVFTFPLWQPLFVVDETDIVFEGLPLPLQPTFAALPIEQRRAYEDLLATYPALAVGMAQAQVGATDAVIPTEQWATPTMLAPLRVARGIFSRLDELRWAQGSVAVMEDPDGRKILQFRDFTSARGPDLRVILWAGRIPNDLSDAAELADFLVVTPLDESSVDLGPLQGQVGDQFYIIPTQIDLRQYNSIVLYSARYQMPYSVARLIM
jgi:hypothetical protein